MHLSILQKKIIVGVDYSVVYRVDELIENKINPINIGLASQVSTPKIFSEKADEAFKNIYQMGEQ